MTVSCSCRMHYICCLFLAVLGLSCSMQALLAACGPFSSCSAQGLVAPAACGILVPWPGFEPVSPALVGGFLTTEPPGKSLQRITLRHLLVTSVVPSLFGTRDWFCGRQVFHRLAEERGGFRMIQAHYIYCVLCFYYYYIVIYNEVII